MKTKELTVTEIQEIAARAEKATPGPWNSCSGCSLWIGDEESPDNTLSGDAILTGKEVVIASTHYDLEPKGCDLDFIAAARLDVPALCETALAAIAERDALATRILNAHGKALPPNWVYTDSETTLDLLVAEITTLRTERDRLRARLATTIHRSATASNRR